MLGMNIWPKHLLKPHRFNTRRWHISTHAGDSLVNESILVVGKFCNEEVGRLPRNEVENAAILSTLTE